MIGIDAGEVDGKEGLPILAREIISQPDHPLLKNMVLVFAPIFNCDGNERVSKDNRPGSTARTRAWASARTPRASISTAIFVKLESPEVRRREIHQRLGPRDLRRYAHDQRLVSPVRRHLRGPGRPRGRSGPDRVRGHDVPRRLQGPGGQSGAQDLLLRRFQQGAHGRGTASRSTRSTTNYVGLRGRISILSEGYSYSSYKERVLGTRDFVRTCLEFASTNKDHIRKLLADADRRTIDLGRNPPKDPKPEQQLAVRSKAAKVPETMKAAGFVEEVRE